MITVHFAFSNPEVWDSAEVKEINITLKPNFIFMTSKLVTVAASNPRSTEILLKWCRWTQRLWHCYQFKVVVTDFNVYNHIPWDQRFHVKLMIKNLQGTQCLSLVLAGTNQRHRFYGVFSKMRISFFLKERCLLFPPTFVTITRFCPHSLETKC